MEGTVAYENIIDIPSETETCGICLEDDINDDQMFCIAKCHHKFCVNCVTKHIEVRLLQRSLIRCPHDGCETSLLYESFEHLVTPKVREIWIQRLREDWIPVSERVYCPNPKCSALMSLSWGHFTNQEEESGSKRDCDKCGEPFCTKCYVPWHFNFSCETYKSLYPNHTVNDGKLKALAKKKRWRQCSRCRNMVELSEGCISIECRCGNNFCYRCGATNGGCSHGHQLPLSQQTWVYWLSGFILVLVITAIILVTLHFVGKL